MVAKLNRRNEGNKKRRKATSRCWMRLVHSLVVLYITPGATCLSDVSLPITYACTHIRAIHSTSVCAYLSISSDWLYRLRTVAESRIRCSNAREKEKRRERESSLIFRESNPVMARIQIFIPLSLALFHPRCVIRVSPFSLILNVCTLSVTALIFPRRLFLRKKRVSHRDNFIYSFGESDTRRVRR